MCDPFRPLSSFGACDGPLNEEPTPLIDQRRTGHGRGRVATGTRTEKGLQVGSIHHGSKRPPFWIRFFETRVTSGTTPDDTRCSSLRGGSAASASSGWAGLGVGPGSIWGLDSRVAKELNRFEGVWGFERSTWLGMARIRGRWAVLSESRGVLRAYLLRGRGRTWDC